MENVCIISPINAQNIIAVAFLEEERDCLFVLAFFHCDRSSFLLSLLPSPSFFSIRKPRGMNVRLALLCVVAASLLGLACAAARCSEFTDCASCAGNTTDEGSCVWVTDAQCKQKCVHDTSNDANSIGAFWRGDATSNSEKCSSHNTCLFHRPLFSTHPVHFSLDPITFV